MKPWESLEGKMQGKSQERGKSIWNRDLECSDWKRETKIELSFIGLLASIGEGTLLKASRMKWIRRSRMTPNWG